MKLPNLDARTSKIILLITAGVLALVAFALFVIPALKSSAEVSTKNAGAQLDRTKADAARLAAEKAAREAKEQEIEAAKRKFESEVRAEALRLKNKDLDDCPFLTLNKCHDAIDYANDRGYYFQVGIDNIKKNKSYLIPAGWDVEGFANKTFSWYEDALG